METRINPQAMATVEYRAGHDAPTISGYAAVFYDGTPQTEYQLSSRTVERINRSAFDRALSEDDVRGLFNHDSNFVLGRTSAGTMRLKVDQRGLRYEIDAGTSVGRQVAESIQRGDITGSSFGFEVMDEALDNEGGQNVRNIQAVRLYDVGPVTYPAYTATAAEVRAIESKFWPKKRQVDERIAEIQSILGTM